ncbi:hypothetical protein [Burkholderia ubonensis]|uniref:hypothetical protein n=1 Tax=Burkholderia ubonensis TaxID=101571 RepID=UPI000B0110F7|nr:hypothetical protein [Burkholderia ubonensis]
MATNDFLAFGGGGAANVIDQATYAALAARLTGFQSGTAQSAQLNKVWRQSSIMAAVVAQFAADYSGQNSTDDGTTPTLEANLIAAIRNVTKVSVLLVDTGAANAYAAANTPPLVAGQLTNGLIQQVVIAHTNTGASTYAPDGLTSSPIYGLGLQPLQGGELLINSTAVLMRATIAGVNGGNPIWVLMECAGGAQQVPAATQSQHAMQFSQAGSYQGIVSVSGNYTIPSSGFGFIYQPPNGSSGGFTITLPSASGNQGKCLAIFNSSSGNITLSAGNLNTSYGSGTSIVLPANSTAVLCCDGVSFNGIGGSAGAGSGIRPTSVASVGQWTTPSLTGSGSSTYWTLPAGGAWAYFVSNNGSSATGVSAGGTNVMGPFTAANSIGFCWRIA